jgi:E3 ubiquitin-protein ligase synoviolin
MRDLFMTTRSFVKRLTAFLRYRRATQDMNKRYEDATVEDIQREDTCIICREEMRPWSVTNPRPPPADPEAPPPARPPRPATPANERSRPKKLPCGHILHLGCLKSWLERQQVCPTCRRPVVENGQAGQDALNNQGGHGAQPPARNQQDGAGAAPAAGARAGRRGMRMLNLGPLRVGFGQANLQDLADLGGAQPGQDNAARVYGLELGFPRRQQPQVQVERGANTVNPSSLEDNLRQLEQHILTEIRSLQLMEQELQIVRLLQAELARLRLVQSRATGPVAINPQPHLGVPGLRQGVSSNVPQTQRHGARADTLPIPAGSHDLPPGVTIPEGWSLLPLQRLDGHIAVQSGVESASNTRPTAMSTTAQQSTSSIPQVSNVSPNPIPRTNPEYLSLASSTNSTDTNPIHTPLSTADDHSDPTVLPTPATTLPSTVPTTTTPAQPDASGLSGLANWGSSQVFSGPSNTNNTNSRHQTLAPTRGSVEGNSSIGAEQSSSIPSSISRGDTDEQRKDKGKSRTATVEDVIDDADGS